MENLSAKTKKIYLTIGTALGWLALILQFYLIIINHTASLAETIVRFFSFFTILTNILVTVCFTFLLVKPYSKWGSFFASPSTITALAVYISVVGIVYNVVLRFLWAPHGLQLVVDQLLHTIIPLLFVLYWFLFVPKQILKWKNILPWLIYPAAYCIYTLARGAIVAFYPYPFIDVNILGYWKVLVNIAGLVMVFVFLSIVFVAIAKLITRVLSNTP